MQRRLSIPRPDWQIKAEQIGFTYHTHETGPYWDESVCYEFAAPEINALETAAAELHRLCIEAAGTVIEKDWWDRLGIPAAAVPSILASWERDDFSLYGRFDLCFDGVHPPQLLEYNADTPTALIEASVVQWFWLQDVRPGTDQFNSIHERLIEAWRRWAGTTVHFSSIKENPEDEQTVLYLRDTCEQAGVSTQSICIEDIGWDPRQSSFVDLDVNPIRRCFKLYPWEWIWHEPFGKNLPFADVQWVEPCWKMLLSNKGLLPILWELFPGHPNLLPAFDASEPLGNHFVRKPKLSREGSNVSWVEGGVVIEESGGDYGEEGYVYQALAAMPDFEGHHPVCGVWIVDHEPAGLGVREDTRRITGNLSRFVPHWFQ